VAGAVGELGNVNQENKKEELTVEFYHDEILATGV
jgi:hypothetical protein